ncbi:MAG: DUF4292 domain-containing protein [Desulfobulbaceae bacterium]|nr:DUF4292 domain-containing protein [Desulfobulbaceae bacterium]
MRKFVLSKNRYPTDQGISWAIFFVLVLILSGCAGKLPTTVVLTAAQEQDAFILLQKIRQGNCPDTLDADLSLSWRGYGQRRVINATLQATRNGAFRLSGLDPLGRPFFILVIDGRRFTLVDNLQGRGFTGAVDSSFLQKYIPAGLQLTTCFSFLTAQLPGEGIPLVWSARTEKNKNFWFVFDLGDGMTRQAEIDPERGLVRRQVLMDQKNRIVLDALYEGYQSRAAICAVPGRLTVEGEDLSGSLQITLNKLYRGTRLPDEIFTLRIPEHFTVTEVE